MAALGLVVQVAEPAAPALAQGMTRVRMGLLSSASDAGIFIALDQGYFREAGVELDTTPFDSAARMVAPLGAGQLDAGGGAHSAGLFNAVSRGIPIKLVADKGSSPPGFGFQGLLFRRDLVESGRLRGPGDLRGMRVALPARGITPEVALAGWLRPAGLTLDDIEVAELNFADHLTALGSRAVDASMTIEPFVTRILDQGVGTVYQRTDELLPGYQIAEIIYGGQFIREQPDVARRFMTAYVRALRFYNDAYVGGDAAKRQEIVASLVRHTPVKTPELYDRMVMPGLHPDGRMTVASLEQDQEFWLGSGVQQGRINLAEVVDYTFVDAAVQALGPYR
jgi:NitT/TauT family transport system substrate-binding protein